MSLSAFGVPDNWIIGIITGGDSPLTVENAEDNQAGDLSAYAIFKFRCGDRNCGF
jgi:N-acetylmuramic acid 6-phosphate (MurNAc-6-P) etherase